MASHWYITIIYSLQDIVIIMLLQVTVLKKIINDKKVTAENKNGGS